jgi:purine-binding chemotaxis protein CheW
MRQASRETAASDDRDILIVFAVGGQEFALPIESVIEVLRAPETATALPHSETAVLGMVGLRDTLLPLLSLQALLGLSGESRGGMVIVAAVGGATVGLAADSVQDIIRIDPDELEPVPVVIASRTKGETRVQSVIKANGGKRLIAVLSPDQLFREDIMTRVRQQMPTAGPARRASANASERIFLVFTLGGQEYGLAISAVEEVARLPDQITKLPRSPDFLKGVINLRGSVLPIIDQRRRFELPEEAEGDGRRLVVMRIDANIAGFIVDGVSEVLRTTESAVEPAPDIAGITAVLEGVLNLESSGRMILLLDPGRLLSTTEKGLLDALGRVDEAQSAIDQSTGR